MVNSDIIGCGVRGNILQNFESILLQFPTASAAGGRRKNRARGEKESTKGDGSSSFLSFLFLSTSASQAISFLSLQQTASYALESRSDARPSDTDDENPFI